MLKERPGIRRVGRAVGVAGSIAWVLWLGGPLLAGAASVGEAIGQEVKVNDASAASQKKIDKLSDDTEDLAAQYRAALQSTRSLEIYNRQLESLISSQDREVESLNNQIERVTEVGREITPLMLRMIESLAKFVELDVPFLEEERTDRVQQLRDMMDRADVTISEKYRRLLESYQIEYDYGRNIEAYSGELEQGGTTRTVDFLRIGRLALLYQTLDGQETGSWNQSERKWEILGDEYRSAVGAGIRMARKQVAPDLIEIPLPAAEDVQ
jgi:hypothetical protein